MGISEGLMKCISQCTIKDRELFEARKRNEELTREIVNLKMVCELFRERALTLDTKLHMLQVLYIKHRDKAFT